MRKLLSISVIGFLLAACGAMSTTALFRPGASISQKQNDLDQCKIASLRSIPQAFTTTTEGGFYDPGAVRCYQKDRNRTVCYRSGDIYVPPSSYTVDQNESLRWRFVMGCLRKKGYTVIQNLRPCTNPQERMQAMNSRTVSAFTCNPDSRLDY